MTFQLQEIAGTDPEVVVQVVDESEDLADVQRMVALGEELQQLAFASGKGMAELRYAVRIPKEE